MARIRMTMEKVAGSRDFDRVKVDATTEAEIRRYMIEDGEDPDAPLGTYEIVLSPAAVRKKTGLSQDAFATAIGVPVATLRNWEQGRVSPDPAARSLLTLVADNPQRAFKVLASRTAEVG